MKKNDAVFGKLEYDDVWSRKMKEMFLGNEVEICLIVDCDEDDEFEEEQYIAYEAFVKKSDIIYKEAIQAILSYYKNIREELGYNEEFNEDYPLIETVEDILKHITFSGIVVTESIDSDEREIGLTFECTWNEEDGVGVMIINEKVDEVGYQDITM